MTGARIVGLAPSGALGSAIARGDVDVLDALDALHEAGSVDLLVLGVERLAGARTGLRTDPASVAAAGHRRFPRWGFLLAATPVDDHPYNLARRVSTVDHFSGGRAGVVIGRRATPSTEQRRAPWPVGSATEGELLADAALALRELWNSWPRETLVGEVDSGTFAHTSTIRRIDHRGVFDIDGPLGAPSSVQGEPVLAWWLDDAADAGSASALADLVIVDEVEAAGPAPLVLLRRDPAQLEAGRIDDLPGDGVLVEVSDVAALAGLKRSLPISRARLSTEPRTLRAALGLPTRSIDLSDREPAVAADRTAARTPATSERSTFE